MGQVILKGHSTDLLSETVGKLNAQKYLIVCDSAFKFLKKRDEICEILKNFVMFDGFTPNPKYEEVCKGVDSFKESGCDAIVAIGGGSAIDVAKCIKVFSVMSPNKCYIEQQYTDSSIPLVALPTTAGTGSESTRFAVIYFNGKKISVEHRSVLPGYVILDSELLETLPIYQKKCTMLDALCHSIESWWSVNSTIESIEFSKAAIEKIVKYKDKYFEGDAFAAEQILLASNLAGKAINISKTTGAHAMSYKLTSLYNLPHGHAAAVCLPRLWEFMCGHVEKCIDKRGGKYLDDIFESIAAALGAADAIGGIKKLDRLLKDLQIKAPEISSENLRILVSSVNTERLKNNPVELTEKDIAEIYVKMK